ncbi:MAG TPA: copper homeostasis protein CutC [Candidatus Limnocylindrales bacterium]|jgi:copper homeostasis protein|nr:copper homeostasis protein CutC [Candidatus Limnocylindrales bacterium]
MRIEICVDSAAGALAAQRGGADRVELCDNLLEGGTTPSAGTIKVARAGLKIGLQVIIRPRGGDFLYDEHEMEVMREDIRVAKELGADGVVIGCLTAEGDIDIARTQKLVSLARPLNVTFHRAFDMCRDPHKGLEELISLGIDRVLTSGQEASCLEGMELIAALQKQAAGRIIIMPGGGITPRNIQRIVAGTAVTEVHLSARSTTESGMKHRNSRVYMGGTLRPPEFSWKATDERIVRSVVDALSKHP